MPPPTRILQLAAATALAFTIAYFLFIPTSISRPVTTSFPTAALSPHFAAPEPPDPDVLDRDLLDILNLPAHFTFQRHCITAKEKVGLKREPLIEIEQPLFDDALFVNITNDDALAKPASDIILPPCQKTIQIQVPEFASHRHGATNTLMLGVATSMGRIEQSLPTFSRWLSHTRTPLVALIVDQPDLSKVQADLNRTQELADSLDIEIIFEPYINVFPSDSEGVKNFGLATVLDKHRREETRWFGVIDDDTFFLSLQRMVEELAPYDPTRPWYIGGLTEGHTRISHEGFKAWGGAGFFISPPLMKTLAENAIECIPLDKFFGDLLWRDCIQHVTSPTVHLTEMRGLNQIDIWSDVSGWYEAGFTPILTVHHWKSWHVYPVAVGHVVTDVAGPDTFLQRYKFGNTTVLTNAFSVAQYPNVFPDLNLVELTMTEDVNILRPPDQLEFHHSFGHTRPALELGRDKIQWKFAHAARTAPGIVRQFYVKKSEDELDVSVIELDWRHA